ncbi:MAG: MoaE protein, partial [Bacteroidota bacterium]
MERKIDLSEAPISIDPYFQFLQDPKAGGICLFIGTIRNK